MESRIKTKAVLLFVLQELGGTSDFIKIFKIIYFANQEHLAKYGRPIIVDDFIAMPKGPVPSWLYNAVQKDNKKIETYRPVADSISHDEKHHFIISSTESPDLEELSKTDMDCLVKSIQENKNLSSFELSKKSHDDAWKKHEGRAMSIVDIAVAGGATSEIVEYIMEDQAINYMLACHQ